MTATGTNGGTKVKATQAIVRVDDLAYKVMAFEIGEGTGHDATIQAFLQSIQVKGTPHPGGVGGGSGAGANKMTSDEVIQSISYQLGRATGMVIMAKRRLARGGGRARGSAA